MSIRFVAWLVVGVAAAFLVVATASFSVSAIEWLAFAISIGTLALSTGLAYRCRHDVATLVLASVSAVISAWTVVASLVFSLPTVQNLALASALAIGGLALAGLSENEIESEQVVRATVHGSSESESSDQESRLAAAA